MKKILSNQEGILIVCTLCKHTRIKAVFEGLKILD